MTSAGTPSRIGPYPIEREVGRGGMGIVYLGRDPRLDRPVAIKVLPEAFAGDPDRLARFEREARLLASLTHPNIAGIFGLEEAEGRRFLVLEYIEGETLGERLARGPLPVDEAADIARQIAVALEAAHDSGVIHRDLKPGNVKLTPAGQVKVLDFGLAKGAAGSSSDPNQSMSPTVGMSAAAATGTGVILGTAAYMSPEQARGRPVDRRTDIWSFGCVLYECLTGHQPFAGETVSDTIAHILKGEPDWSALPRETPASMRALLERCLHKDPTKRLRDIGEARLLLEGGNVSLISGIHAPDTAAPARRPAWLPWTLAALATAGALTMGVLLARQVRAPERVRRLELTVPNTPVPTRDHAYAALSPDGTQLVSVGADSTGATYLWLRRLDAVDGRRVPGGQDGFSPSWSPDGGSILFSTQDRLKKLDLRGGTPEDLGAVSGFGRGASWGSRGVIVFSAGAQGPLFKMPEGGGTPEPATTLDSAETGHRYPLFLPDGRHFLYASLPQRDQQHTIYVGSIDGPMRETLMTADGTPVYADPGYLIFSRRGRIMVQSFNAATRTLSGKPWTLPDVPERSEFLGSPGFVACRNGPIAYVPDIPIPTRLVWIGRGGASREPLPAPPGHYYLAALSPEGNRAIIARGSHASSDLWLADVHRGTMSRFTFGPGNVDRPIWSPDGTRIAFSSNRNGRWDIFEKRVDGSDPETPLVTTAALIKYPNCYTADNGTLIYEEISEHGGWNVLQAPLTGDRTPRPLLTTPSDEQYSLLSPDGRWLAFTSNESGRLEIYLQSYPVADAVHQVTTTGGGMVAWRADGRELVSYGPNSFTYVPIDPVRGVATGPGQVQPLPPEFETASLRRDLTRLLAVMREPGAGPANSLIVVLNWKSELARP